ncbi:NifU family protein [Sphingosinicella sp. LY1275]|uniref:NifU family protein n=1 Tax=Sphingosinicella sp. LY1275 TaxID=3095379 RepID=UPI002ADEEDA4|nr:NifU family protein [Sphingosinicella sp. LY1275]MEA1015316.1 NifU family protein [Sphingosinicella sp. LY1275]
MSGAPVIQIERTPNPEALRVLPGIPLVAGPPIELRRDDDAGAMPLAAALLAIEGVASILIGADFVTIVRASPDYDWRALKPQLVVAIDDFIASGQPFLRAPAQAEDAPADEEDEVASHIRQVIDRFVRPMVARDGGEATLARFDPDTGVAYVRMSGACGGCPSGRTTLKQGIERTIMHYVPEVTKVEALEPRSQAEGDPKARFRAWIAARFGQDALR